MRFQRNGVYWKRNDVLVKVESHNREWTM